MMRITKSLLASSVNHSTRFVSPAALDCMLESNSLLFVRRNRCDELHHAEEHEQEGERLSQLEKLVKDEMCLEN